MRSSDMGGLSGAGWAVVVLGCIALLVVAIVGLNFLTKFKAVDQGHVCVVKQGGPFDGRSIAYVRQPGSGVKNIGLFNKQLCFPATQRNYIISSDPSLADSKTADNLTVSTLDAVNVGVEGQALFTLSTDPAVIKLFYKKYGARTYNGKHPYDGDSGWANFLQIYVRPALETSLREAIGGFNCTELNNTCQYVTDAQNVLKKGAKQVSTTQNLQQAATRIQAQLTDNVNQILGGKFFDNIRWQFSGRGVTFSPQVQEQITQAQSKRTEVATQQLEAQRQVAEAAGQRQVAVQQAKGRLAAAKLDAAATRAKARAYRLNPAQVRIEVAKALAGGNIQAVGGGVINQLGG